jgi:hypothetical protein
MLGGEGGSMDVRVRRGGSGGRVCGGRERTGMQGSYSSWGQAAVLPRQRPRKVVMVLLDEVEGMAAWDLPSQWQREEEEGRRALEDHRSAILMMLKSKRRGRNQTTRGGTGRTYPRTRAWKLLIVAPGLCLCAWLELASVSAW